MQGMIISLVHHWSWGMCPLDHIVWSHLFVMWGDDNGWKTSVTIIEYLSFTFSVLFVDKSKFQQLPFISILFPEENYNPDPTQWIH